MDILVLWAAVLALFLSYLAVRRAAGWLQVTYLLWVSFATLLNAAIWKLN